MAQPVQVWVWILCCLAGNLVDLLSPSSPVLLWRSQGESKLAGPESWPGDLVSKAPPGQGQIPIGPKVLQAQNRLSCPPSS